MPAGQPVGERITWDDANEKHLLLCILAEANPQKLDWSRIAERFGHSLSSGAASQKFGKIKNRDKAIFEHGRTDAATPGKKGGPAKTSSKGATPKPKRTINGRSKQASMNDDLSQSTMDDAEHDDDDEYMTPSKKVKVKPELFDPVDSAMDDMDDEV